jgi:leader peptidase (prepilin peptidase)/N-methyltransferase
MSTTLAFELPAFLLGLLFGSFLNVCISRLPDHRSISKPRSHCPHCQKTIRFYDNVPLLSWVLLRGRCRNCKEPISWRYPAVELAVGVWFAVAALPAVRASLFGMYSQLTTAGYASVLINSVSILILGFLLIGLIVMDWQTYRLPDAFTITGIVIDFVLICAQSVFLAPHANELLLQGRNPLTSPGNVTDRGNVILTGPEHLILGRLLAIVAAGSILWSIRYAYCKVRKIEGMGLGDVKLIAMIAAFLGFWPAVLTIFLGFIFCSIYAVALLARGRANAATHLPLGTFLSVGGLIAAVFGVPLIAWYTSLL